MSEWREFTLGEVCELKRGYDLPHASRRDGSVPIISSSGPTGFHAEAKAEAPGVVTGRYGTLGSVFYVEEDFWPLNTALYVRDFKGNDPRYVAELLRTMNLSQYDGAAAVPGLNRNQLHTVRVRIPDPSTQQVVASVASGFDDLIENNRRRVEVLEEMARAIYREWFVKFRYPGHEGVPLVDSVLGPIPEGWKRVPLGEVVSLDRTGIQPGMFPSELFDHYSLPAFDRDRSPALDVGAEIKSSKFVVSAPAVLVPKLNPRINRTWYVEPVAERRSIASTEYLVLRPREAHSLAWLHLLATSQPFRDRLVSLSGGTSTSHQRTKPQDLLKIEVIVAPQSVSARLTDTVAPMLSEARKLIKQGDRLTRLLDLLLPRLVTGQIDVSTLDLDALAEGAVA